MRSALPAAVVVLILAVTPFAFALTTGSDVLVPAAGRGAGTAGSSWITDLYVLNPGGSAVAVQVIWLERNRANPSPQSRSFSLASGETLVLEDVILETFDMTAGSGAFRVMADGEVAVSSRIYNRQGDVTFGQGFEGVPRAGAVRAGGSTDVMGLTASDSFRSNVVLIDATDDQNGSRVVLSLRDRLGATIASRAYELDRLEPRLFPATDLGASSFENATLHLEVTSGAAIMAAAKVDNDPATGDPTTLEPWVSAGPGAVLDGTYQLAIYDSYDYAAGGRLVFSDGGLTAMTTTYFNWDKVDGSGYAECQEMFFVSETFDPPVTLSELGQGLTIGQSYQAGALSLTLSLTVTENLTIAGTIDAVGSGFPLGSTGCNGAFPTLVLSGGKSR